MENVLTNGGWLLKLVIPEEKVNFLISKDSGLAKKLVWYVAQKDIHSEPIA